VLRPGPSNGLAASTAVGEPLALAALVLGADCGPAAGAEVNLWHADARGRYGPEGSEECCYYAGTVRTDPAGRFRLDTVRPARYPERGAPPAHIHLEIRHPAGRVDTELIFDRPAPTGPAGPSGHVLPVALRRDGPGWRGEVVFVLSGPA
jgi:protocatechuate 3,4-dioxygenase beta subunit